MRRILLAPALALSLSASMLGPASAQYIPSGSYQQSCQNIHYRNNMLVARCNGPNGQLVRSSIDPRTCRGGDIANMNGQLTCNGGRGRYGRGNGYGYGNNGYGNNGYGNNGYGNNGYGYGRGGVAGGSYRQSCTNAYMRNGLLYATCPGRGTTMTTSIDPRSCRGGDIANVDGRLQCR
jgi:CVNH domain